MGTIQTKALTALQAKLGTLTHINFTPVVEKHEDVLVEDNRLGVWHGTDRHGAPMPPLVYRQGHPNPGVQPRKGDGFGVVFGSFKPGPGANLTTAQYRQLTGPRLAGRGDEARVIANLVTRSGKAGGTWFAEGAWADVVSKKGVPFLAYHFNGDAPNPKYDLRGVRPWGLERARAILYRFCKTLLKTLFP